jgi:hypothetical protein
MIKKFGPPIVGGIFGLTLGLMGHTVTTSEFWLLLVEFLAYGAMIRIQMS